MQQCSVVLQCWTKRPACGSTPTGPQAARRPRWATLSHAGPRWTTLGHAEPCWATPVLSRAADRLSVTDTCRPGRVPGGGSTASRGPPCSNLASMATGAPPAAPVHRPYRSALSPVESAGAAVGRCHPPRRQQTDYLRNSQASKPTCGQGAVWPDVSRAAAASQTARARLPTYSATFHSSRGGWQGRVRECAGRGVVGGSALGDELATLRSTHASSFYVTLNGVSRLVSPQQRLERYCYYPEPRRSSVEWRGLARRYLMVLPASGHHMELGTLPPAVGDTLTRRIRTKKFTVSSIPRNSSYIAWSSVNLERYQTDPTNTVWGGERDRHSTPSPPCRQPAAHHRWWKRVRGSSGDAAPSGVNCDNDFDP